MRPQPLGARVDLLLPPGQIAILRGDAFLFFPGEVPQPLPLGVAVTADVFLQFAEPVEFRVDPGDVPLQMAAATAARSRILEAYLEPVEVAVRTAQVALQLGFGTTRQPLLIIDSAYNLTAAVMRAPTDPWWARQAPISRRTIG